MANLHKKPITITDPKSGKRVKAKSKKWWGRYRDEHGIEKRVPLATDKTAAQTLLNTILIKVERRAAGIEDPCDKHRRRPLDEHIKDFTKYLQN